MKKLIIGNWKMNLGLKASLALAKAVRGIKSANEVAICPSDFALVSVKEILKGSSIKLGAQNCFWEKPGAWTGETAVASLKEIGCEYVILGHSEQRALGESCRKVNLKAKAVLAAGLTPIICVGEDATQRKAGKSQSFVKGQIQRALVGIKTKKLIVAYEPLWAIGSGKPAKPAEAEAMHAMIKQVAGKLVGQAPLVLYGGSVDAKNGPSFLKQPNIDGLLIGGASLKAGEFKKIANFK